MSDKFTDIVSQWQHQSRQKRKQELDFSDPQLLEQIKEENRVQAEEQWRSMGPLNRTKSIIKQFLPLSRVDGLGIVAKDKTSFVLKTRRIEYTFEYFRQITRQRARKSKSSDFVSVKDRADEAYIWNLQFNALRLIDFSTLLGVNIAFFAHCLVFRRLKVYLQLPLFFGVMLLARNLISKNCLERIYFPLEPIYEEIRKHRTVTDKTPSGINDANNLQLAADYIPVEERQDLSSADKAKARLHYENRMKSSAQAEAKMEVERELQHENQQRKEMLYRLHGRFINETDFPKGGPDAYRRWIDLYIRLTYEPIDEVFEETRYFTEDYEQSMTMQCIKKGAGKSKQISAIRVKQAAPRPN